MGSIRRGTPKVKSVRPWPKWYQHAKCQPNPSIRFLVMLVIHTRRQTLKNITSLAEVTTSNSPEEIAVVINKVSERLPAFRFCLLWMILMLLQTILSTFNTFDTLSTCRPTFIVRCGVISPNVVVMVLERIHFSTSGTNNETKWDKTVK